MELMIPKNAANLAIFHISHLLGDLRLSLSRLSVEMASSGISESRFVKRI